MRDITAEEQILKPCEIEGCGEPCFPVHHIFPNTKHNRETFGWIIDLSFNKQYICPGHHTSHAGQGMPGFKRWNKCEFIKELRKFLVQNGIKKP